MSENLNSVEKGKARLSAPEEMGRKLVATLLPEIMEWESTRRSCRIKVGLIGLGKMGLLHSGIVGLLLGSPISVIVDKSRLIAAIASRLVKKVKVSTSLGSILEESVDAVFVTTPSETHKEIIKWLWTRGFKGYVFVEKPPTLSLEEYLDLKKSIGAYKTMVGYQKRFSSPFRHLKALLDSGAMGRVQRIEAKIASSDILEKTTRFDKTGRGVLLDLGIHVVDLLVWLLGRGFKVEKACLRRIHTRVDDYFEATLSHKSVEGKVKIVATWSKPGFREPQTVVSVIGEKGRLRVTEDSLEASLQEPTGLLGEREKATLYRPHYYQGVPPVNLAHQEYVVEDIHFLLAVCKKKEPETSILKTSATMELLEELYSEADSC